jgi:cysteine desulfurase
VSKIEHHAVINVAKHLENQGFEVTYMPVDSKGLLDPDLIMSEIKDNTILVSLMYANNEIGTIQPIKEIGKKIKNYRDKKSLPWPYFHTDACQAPCYLDINVNKLNVDLMTINGSKVYGPKGIGLLYKNKHVEIDPIIFGGSQEFGLRPGTENVANIVGFAKAIKLAGDYKNYEKKRLKELYEYFIDKLDKNISGFILNGSKKNRLPNNINISIKGIEGESMLLYLDAKGICVSTGSACTSKELDPSHVLLALGIKPELAHGSIRFTLGKCNNKNQVDKVVAEMKNIIPMLREMSSISSKVSKK